ncbi:MAG: hypothetical protein ACM3KM_01910 [Acidobacteriaceae bacterium]
MQYIEMQVPCKSCQNINEVQHFYVRADCMILVKATCRHCKTSYSFEITFADLIRFFQENDSAEDPEATFEAIDDSGGRVLQ